MEDSKAESFLYIKTFEEEITRLCDPYTHPTYLSLLGDLSIFKEGLLEELREALNKAIDDALSPKDQTSSNDKGSTSDQIINLKKELKDKITSILGVDQKDSSKDATSSKQPSPEEVIDLITLENDLLSLLESYPLPETIKKETVSELTRALQDCFNKAKNQAKESIRSIINREVEVIGETSEKGEPNKDEQDANQKDKIKQEQSGNGETAEGKEESKQGLWFSPFPKETKRTLERRCARLDEIIKDLWIPFSKSLLEGEFLKDPEYSKKLQDIVEKIRNTYDSTLSEDVIYLHPILPCIHELCQELSYVCQCVRIQIEEPREGQEDLHNKRRVFHAPVSYLARKPYAGGVNSGEMLKANLFHDLGKKLIEMTRIDLSGVIDDQAVSHLFLLYKQCNLLLKNEESNLLDFPSNTEIEGIFKSIRAKTSLLLFQSFYKPSVTSKICKIDMAQSIARPYERAKNFEILYEGERYHLTDTGRSSGIKLLYEQIKDFEDLTIVALSEEYSQGDILKYDNYIQRGKEGREDLLKDKEERMKFLKDLLQNPDKGHQREQVLHLPLDVLLSLMKELREKKKSDHKQQTEEPAYDNSRYVKAMGFLLKCFYERLLIYKDFVAAEQKKDKYANSFYKLNEIDQKIFISSFGCKLLHTQALQDEAYHKYNQTYREWLSEAQEETMEKTTELKNAAEKAQVTAMEVVEKAKKTTMEVVEKAKKTTMEAVKVAKEAVEKAKETTMEAVERAANVATTDTRKEAISILSIFVALITFISGGISILQGTNSLADYLILTGTLYIFIATIISVLYFRSIEGDQKESKMRHHSRRIILVGSITFAIVAIIAGVLFKRAEEKTGKDDGRPKVNYGVENIKQIFLSGEQTISLPSLSDSVGFNASTNEKQGGSTDKKQKK
ncbi:MAG: hypothetical protein ACTTJ0_07115 [Porphyromonas endodontalis]|uniref:hypothetical protein n=1 Tax=Porphyromonas endodontalis TaxID=28124 RepID=UPI003FA07E4C